MRGCQAGPSSIPSRVLLLHSSAGLYGADLQLIALASGLRARGFDVAAVLPERGELAPLLEDVGAQLHVHPLAVLRRRLLRPAGIARLARDAWSERERLASLARECSVVHSNTSVILGGQAAASAAGVPHVIHVREIYTGIGAPTRAWPLWRRRLLRADALACVSGAVATQFGSPKATVIHDGVARPELWQATAAHRVGEAGAPFSVAVLGRIADWKGQDVLVRALAEPELAEIGAVALVAGDAYPGEDAPDIAALARELGVAERVQMLGFRANPAEILAAADAVAVPSTRPDPLPNSALEALTAGKPVVAAAHGGLPEIVSDGETGLLVRPGDPHALAVALRRLADDPAERTRMGERAAADARGRFGIERMLDEVEALYARLGVRNARAVHH